jgi:transformation/transcription domain-associated protein
MPYDEDFRPHVERLMQCLLLILGRDNEETACACLKVFIDLHKSYKANIEDFVQPFLDIVLQMYKNMPETVKIAFDESSNKGKIADVKSDAPSVASPGLPLSPTGNADSAEVTAKPLRDSLHSFKVLTECPIIIVLLFSTYRQSVQPNLLLFTPVIIDMLSLQAQPQAKQHDLGEKSKQAVQLAPSLRSKPVYGDFVLAQIKTLSFLAYVLRGFTTFMKKYAPVIPGFVVRLLQDCPPEMSAARKV